jgi:hypothetical protein
LMTLLEALRSIEGCACGILFNEKCMGVKVWKRGLQKLSLYVSPYIPIIRLSFI